MTVIFGIRPWLIASVMRPISPRSSLGRKANLKYARRGYAAARSKTVDPRLRTTLNQMEKDRRVQKATSTINAAMIKSKMAVTDVLKFAVLAPNTFVPMRPSSLPKGLTKKFLYYKRIIWQRIMDRTQILAQSMPFRPKWYKRSTLSMTRKGLVEVALDLHASMSKHLAEGTPDAKAQLRRICVPKLASNLIAIIEARPRGKSYRWERLSILGWPFWPRVVDHKWQDVNVGVQLNFRQAVVGIRSQQRLTELNVKGEHVESKKKQLTEYLVLWRQIDTVSQTQGNWMIYGTLKETTYGELMKQSEMYEKLAELNAQEKLLERQRMLSGKK